VLTVLALDDLGARTEGITEFAVALALTLVAVLVFGWAEDLAAKRRPRFWPVGPTSRPATPAQDGPAAPPYDGPAAPQERPASLQERPASLQDRPASLPAAAAPVRDSGRRTGAAAAMSAMPRNWPPLPRTGHPGDDSETAADGRHTVGGVTRDLGLPVAGRRIEPLVDTPPAEAPPGAEPDDETPDWFLHRRDGRH
jgi:hypothetical protein